MTQRLFCSVAAIGLAILLAVPVGAQLTPYSQDFEGLDAANPAALAEDGWLVFGNVFGPDWSYWYGYGPFPAPNGGAGFSAVDSGQGDADQGAQQLSIYSDYNNGDHGNGAFIEANVFQEQFVTAADVGSTWRFAFDAKAGNIEGATTALAFYKTLDPNAGFALTNFITADMTGIPAMWGSHVLEIFIDPSLEGQILQFGFLSLATGYQGSGIFYDNVNFSQAPLDANLDIRPGSCPNPLNRRSRGLVPAALLGSDDLDVAQIDIASLQLAGVAPSHWSWEDVSGPNDGDVCACAQIGPDGVGDLMLKFPTQQLADAIGNDIQLTLTGQLLDGTPIEGVDCVLLVGGGAASGTEFGVTGGVNSLSEAATTTETTVAPDTHPRSKPRKPAPRRSRLN